MDNVPKAVAICAAMQWEIRPLFRCLSNVQRAKLGDLRFWAGTAGRLEVLVFRTGIGVERAEAATRALIVHRPPDMIINTGYAGGLVENLNPGSLVVAGSLLCEEGGTLRRYQTTSLWNDRFAAAARAAGLPIAIGPVLTVRRPLTTSAAKRDAHARLGALAVEMEGAAVARVAQTCGVPLASVRVVLDPVATNLPGRPRVTPTDIKSPGMLRSAIALPKMRHFFALANDLISANRSLRAFFSALLSTI